MYVHILEKSFCWEQLHELDVCTSSLFLWLDYRLLFSTNDCRSSSCYSAVISFRNTRLPISTTQVVLLYHLERFTRVKKVIYGSKLRGITLNLPLLEFICHYSKDSITMYMYNVNGSLHDYEGKMDLHCTVCNWAVHLNLLWCLTSFLLLGA